MYLLSCILVICYGLIVYRVRRKWKKSIALGTNYDGSRKRHSSPALATETFVAASAILNSAVYVDPTNSEKAAAAIAARRRERRRASLAYGDSRLYEIISGTPLINFIQKAEASCILVGRPFK